MNSINAAILGLVLIFPLVAMEKGNQKKQKRVSWSQEEAQIKIVDRYLATPAEEFSLLTDHDQFSKVMNILPGVLLNKKRDRDQLLKLYGFDETKYKIGDVKCLKEKISFAVKQDGNKVKAISLKLPKNPLSDESDEKKSKKDEDIDN